jgi:hypothetical protein
MMPSIFFINFAIMISAIGHARGFMAAWKNSTKKEVVEQKLIAKSANACSSNSRRGWKGLGDVHPAVW